jgi:hypothetical protein
VGVRQEEEGCQGGPASRHNLQPEGSHAGKQADHMHEMRVGYQSGQVHNTRHRTRLEAVAAAAQSMSQSSSGGQGSVQSTWEGPQD